MTVINNTATPASSNPIIGTFTNLPQGGTISASYGGTTYFFQANYAGGDGNDLVLTAIPPVPAVTGISLSRGPATGGTAVTITGTNLTGATAVDFGSTAATITSDTATQITAVSPAGTGVVDVTVTTAGGTSAKSSADQFSYTPVVAGISPASGPATGGTTVTITGAGFTGPRR